MSWKNVSVALPFICDYGCNISMGSVVTKYIPPNCVAVGNPCRVMREVGEHDRKYYFKDREINHEEWAD